MLEHPDITRVRKNGYPSVEPAFRGIDGLGNPIYENDEILEFDDQIYLVDEISSDAIEILERHGANYRIAD